MAEDRRAVAKGSTSRNVYGFVGLYFRSRCLQPSPNAEYVAGSNVGQGRGVRASDAICCPSADAIKAILRLQNQKNQRGSKFQLCLFPQTARLERDAKAFSYNIRTMESAMVPFSTFSADDESISCVLPTH